MLKAVRDELRARGIVDRIVSLSEHLRIQALVDLQTAIEAEQL